MVTLGQTDSFAVLEAFKALRWRQSLRSIRA